MLANATKEDTMDISVFGFFFTALFFSSSAFSKEIDESVYSGLLKDSSGNFQVKFVFSETGNSNKKFAPIIAYTISPNVEKKSCGFNKTDNLYLPQEYKLTPLYDFSDKRDPLPIEKIPVYFATVISAEMARKKLVTLAEDSLPYHTCTRILWERLLGINKK
ncbi:MAG: hypothetical protein AB2803_04655 [Candidatus Thiodiazotropha sp.]